MKIEKVNDNQIRCTLTKQDLEERQIKMSELAYGSDKAKDLFKDMIKQANHEFGFEPGDIPLMIEAIPLPTESIILVITKVEYPEELDTRFSKFSEDDEEDYEEDDDFSGREDKAVSNELFDSLKSENMTAKPDKVFVEVAATMMFEVATLDSMRVLARAMNGIYFGKNDLYKHPRNGKYYLLVSRSDHSVADYNKICNQITEYAIQKQFKPSIMAFFEEHGKPIVLGNALQIFATL